VDREELRDRLNLKLHFVYNESVPSLQHQLTKEAGTDECVYRLESKRKAVLTTKTTNLQPN